MEALGMSLAMVAMFVAFGLLIGTLFGFFGMGGSFLLTPALLVMGYGSDQAVGAGLAFVFATAVIATMKHRDLGQVDYKLGVLMIAGTTVGLEIGKELLNHLQEMGLGDVVLGVTYVFLLGGIGLFVTRNAMKGDDGGGSGAIDHDAGGDVEDADIPDVARTIQSYHVPPMISLKGGYTISLWMILAVGFATGLLSGFLGVGGGFIRMPALFYLLGVPVPIAVGTDLFEIVFSGGIGSFMYALEGGINLSIVVPLLAGSALGARIGSASTSLVDEEDIKVYFGLMLVGGSISVAAQQLGEAYGIQLLNTVSIVIIFGAAILVAGAVVVSAVEALREEALEERASPAD